MHWIVGDVHGCARELERLLGTVRFDACRDALWCVGDLVNTGPDSLEVLRLWRDVGGCTVLGNHDVYALRVFAGTRDRREDTLDALLAAPDAAELLDRLRRQPLLHRLPDLAGLGEIWLVHAGLQPAWRDLGAIARRLNAPPHDNTRWVNPWTAFATRVRCCTADGEMDVETGPPPDCCAPPFRPWDAFYRGEAFVVHGHWARRGFYRNRRTMSLDSGCVYGGALTAWCVEEDRLVRVPALKGGTGTTP